MKNADTSDYDFRHHLHDTLVLLGAKQAVCDLLKKSLDSRIVAADVEMLRNYNIELLGLTKDRLNNLNKIKINIPRPPD